MNTHKEYNVQTQTRLDELWKAYVAAEAVSESSDYQPHRVKAAELAYRAYVLAKQEAYKEKMLLQNGEIFGVIDRPCMVVARVAVRNGKVSELIDIELTKEQVPCTDKSKKVLSNLMLLHYSNKRDDVLARECRKAIRNKLKISESSFNNSSS